jgi:hypothetical protein
MRPVLSLVAVVGLVLAAGCGRPSGTAPATGAAATSSAAPAAASAGKATVAKIVFVGKQDACDCTKKAIDASWKALEAGLGPKNRIPIERLQSDTQADKVAAYQGRKAFFALPAIYFLDQTDSLVELLQGEVTQDQVRAALK